MAFHRCGTSSLTNVKRSSGTAPAAKTRIKDAELVEDLHATRLGSA